jgi:hypothetical protein
MYRPAMRRLASLIVLAGCGEDVPPRPLHYDLGTCGVVDIVREESGQHHASGTPIEWATNPPTSGDHFATWAGWDRSYTVLDRGFWVHNLEHGAVVLLYRCDAGCAAEVAALEDAVRAMPVDEACEAPVKRRALVVADPLLPADVTFAAVAWGAMYNATCVDPDAIAAFTSDFYARAPEDLCFEGASLGGTRIE